MGTVFPNRVISGNTEVDWSPRGTQRLDAVSFGLQMQPPEQTLPSIYTGRASLGSYLQIFYSYAAANAVLQPPSSVTNAISMVTARGYLSLLDRLGVYFAPKYDLNAHHLLSDVVGVRLESPCDCWFFDFAINQSYNPNNTSYMIQVTLGGLGSIGQVPFGLNPFQVAGFLPQAPAQMIRAPLQPGPAM